MREARCCLVSDAAANAGGVPFRSYGVVNVDFQDVKAPFSGGYFTPSSGKVNGVNYDYVLASGNYQMASLSMSGKTSLYVSADAVLYVTGNFSMAGQSSIELASGATLKLYVGGPSGAIGGNGIINNGKSALFNYYGLPGNTSLSFAGNAAFTGTIYAPNADFALNGGGNNTYDFVGASVTKTATLNGHFNFHYDEALGVGGPARNFVVTSWNEMTPEEVASLPISY